MKIYLNYYKAKKYDYKAYMAKYNDSTTESYRLLNGAPKLINVEGTYIEVNQLLELCKPSVRMIINQYIMSLLNTKFSGPNLEFVWNR